ncbi:MAG: helix-turn-helix domain-containing protein [Peptococcales bacterium]
MDGIGSIFKSARIEKGLTLVEAQEATKIRIKYLEAIEDGQFDIIPGKVYLKGFIKSYAKFLAIEDNEEIICFLEDNKSPTFEVSSEKVYPQKIESPKGVQKKYFKILLGLLAILVLFGVQHLYENYFAEQNNLPEPPKNIVTEIPPDPEEPPLPDETDIIQQPQKKELSIEVLDITSAKDACWVQIYTDNNKEFEGIMYQGEKKTIEALEKIKIKLGNAGVVKLLLDEEDLGIPGKVNQVWEKEFIISESHNSSLE